MTRPATSGKDTPPIFALLRKSKAILPRRRLFAVHIATSCSADRRYFPEGPRGLIGFCTAPDLSGAPCSLPAVFTAGEAVGSVWTGAKNPIATATSTDVPKIPLAQNFRLPSSGIHTRSHLAKSPINTVGKIKTKSHGVPKASSPSLTHRISENPSNAKAIRTANVTL